jgi:cell division protein FtsX
LVNQPKTTHEQNSVCLDNFKSLFKLVGGRVPNWIFVLAITVMMTLVGFSVLNSMAVASTAARDVAQTRQEAVSFQGDVRVLANEVQNLVRAVNQQNIMAPQEIKEIRGKIDDLSSRLTRAELQIERERKTP